MRRHGACGVNIGRSSDSADHKVRIANGSAGMLSGGDSNARQRARRSAFRRGKQWIKCRYAAACGE
jgi:hypothetical protein